MKIRLTYLVCLIGPVVIAIWLAGAGAMAHRATAMAVNMLEVLGLTTADATPPEAPTLARDLGAAAGIVWEDTWGQALPFPDDWTLRGLYLAAGTSVLLTLLVAVRLTRRSARPSLKNSKATSEGTVADEEWTAQISQLNAALSNMAQGLCMFDSDHRLVVSNRRFEELYGLAPGAVLPGMPLWDVWETCREFGIYTDEQLVGIEADLAKQLRTLEPLTYTETLKNGRIISVARVPLPDGGWVTTFEDVTERKLSEAKIEHMALHDALTGLPNRSSFRIELERGLAGVAQRQFLAVLYLDLDRFKSVNDTLGHPVGDLLLQEVARRLKGCLRASSLVARLGGDEFAVIDTNIAAMEEAGILAARIVDTLSKPYEIKGYQVITGTSVGIALAPANGTDPDKLIMAADLALYRAKADGRGTFRFFETYMEAGLQHRHALEVDLRKAVTRGDLQVCYQPILDLRSNRVTCFEALLRWEHPTLGSVPPSEFIPLAEETGLINEIGRWVLGHACQAAAQWPQNMRVAVNLSPKQFRSLDLLSEVESALASSGLVPSRLELEVTETILLQQTEQTLAILKQLRAIGVKLSMDDFGTGYSSLSYLRSFSFDKIKIDQSFIKDLVEKSDAQAIVRAISGMGSSLGMTTTAEGVECQEQLEWLRTEGCLEVQGYFISPAVRAEQVAPLLATLERARRPVSLAAYPPGSHRASSQLHAG